MPNSKINHIQTSGTLFDVQDARINAISSSDNGKFLKVGSDGTVSPAVVPDSGVLSVTAADNSITVGGTAANPTVGAKLSSTPGLLTLGADGLTAPEAANTVHDANYKHITVTSSSVSDGTTTLTPTDTTYTFADGTGGFTVTPSGGSAQTVTVATAAATVSVSGGVKYAQGTFSLATTDWAAGGSYTDYPQRASIAITDCTADFFPDVALDLATATGGKVAPVAETYAGGIYLYAKEAVACTGTFKVTYNL